MMTKLKVGSRVRWKWLGREIEGVIEEVYTESVTKTIKGKSIKRNGTVDKPAYLVKSISGNLALKLATELIAPSDKAGNKPRKKPTMFD